MIDGLFWLAVACGVASASTGNRTAWALLASVGLCIGLDAAQVPFSFPLWLLIDLAVVLVIIRPQMSAADCLVLALFIPAWVAYLLPDDQRFHLSSFVVIAQLLLTLPVATAWRALRKPTEPEEGAGFDRMMAHA
jgi:hypothetical protein